MTVASFELLIVSAVKFSSKSNPNPDSEDDDFIDCERDYEQHVNQQHREIHLNRTFHSDPKSNLEEKYKEIACVEALNCSTNREKVEDLP